ncbi:MAG TPA: CopG family transcriptional regulator [Gemmatimonadales bacterium]|nr:CopG family transcriptional regulator [Gemmatimonadales bacterium]
MSAKRRVSEPVQVYLDAVERQRLERLAQHLGATKSDVLRRALEALERQTSDPDAHPALQIIGLADRPQAGGPAYDVARDHDRFLADSEEASWGRDRGGRPPRRRAR